MFCCWVASDMDDMGCFESKMMIIEDEDEDYDDDDDDDDDADADGDDDDDDDEDDDEDDGLFWMMVFSG